MRICVNALLVVPGRTGGGETFLVNLWDRLRRLDARNEYLILVTQENAHLFPVDGQRFRQKLIRGARSRFVRLLFETTLLPFGLLLNRVDLYYSPFGTLPPILFCRSVVTIQNLIYFDFASNVPFRGSTLFQRLATWLQAAYYSFLTPMTLRQADRIWVISRETACQISQRFPSLSPAIEVIYPGVDFAHFNRNRANKSLPPSLPQRYVLTVAQLYPNKNIDKLIRSFAEVVRTGLPHHLLVVGADWNGYQRLLEAAADAAGIRDRVLFAGAVPHSDLPPYFWRAELFLLLSNIESFGLPVLEAMAAGVPVMISDRPALPEVAGGAAVVTSPEDRYSLGKQIVRILTDRNLQQRMRHLGIQRARSFDWNETAARAIDLFNRTLQSEVTTIQGRTNDNEVFIPRTAQRDSLGKVASTPLSTSSGL